VTWVAVDGTSVAWIEPLPNGYEVWQINGDGEPVRVASYRLPGGYSTDHLLFVDHQLFLNMRHDSHVDIMAVVDGALSPSSLGGNDVEMIGADGPYLARRGVFTPGMPEQVVVDAPLSSDSWRATYAAENDKVIKLGYRNVIVASPTTAQLIRLGSGATTTLNYSRHVITEDNLIATPDGFAFLEKMDGTELGGVFRASPGGVLQHGGDPGDASLGIVGEELWIAVDHGADQGLAISNPDLARVRIDGTVAQSEINARLFLLLAPGIGLTGTDNNYKLWRLTP
jgi:hypothetical protein